MFVAFVGCFAAGTLPSRGEEPALSEAVVRAAAALREKALAGTHAFEILKSLTVEVGSRFAGSMGDAAAVAWGLRTLKKLGLSNVHSEAVKVPRWVRGPASGEILRPYAHPLALVSLGGSVSTAPEGIEAEVIEVASLEALKAVQPEAVRGKIVFFNQKTERARDGSGYGKAVDVRSRGAIHASQAGAVAVLIRSIGTDQNRLPHTGGMWYDDKVPKISAAALSNPDADLLAAEIASGQPVSVRLRISNRELGQAESANVVGEIPGREHPEEIVLLAAHLDSWDLGPGALDDGAGCAIVIETARLIAEVAEKPRRTIRVVLFANEEFGLSGAKAYAKAHEAELARHIAATEADFGAARVWRFRSRVAPEKLAAADAIAKLLAPLGVARGDNRTHGGADLIPLRAARVPLFSLMQDGSHYFDVHHTANDTLDKADPKDLDQNVAAYATFAYCAAEMNGGFGEAPPFPQKKQ
jgi:hypothetical protein